MITYVFGGIGAGKTTYGVKILKRELDKIHSGKSPYKNLFCNFYNKLVPRVSMDEFGPKVFPDYSLVIIDESGIDFNNRMHKKMLIATIEEFKLSRHRHCDMIVISQGWDDTDLVIRRLCERYLYLKWCGPFTTGRLIIKTCDIDKETHEPRDFYRYERLIWCLLPPPFYRKSFFIFRRKPFYPWFDSYDAPKKPLMTIKDCPSYYLYAKNRRNSKKMLRKYIKSHILH